MVGGERLGLAAEPVQREHQVGPHPFAEWVPRGERVELGDDGRVPAHLDLRRDAVLGGRQVEFLQSRDLAPERGLVRQVGERRAAPEREGPRERGGGLRGVGQEVGLGGLDHGLEPRGVDLGGIGSEHVAPGLRGDPIVAEHLPQPVHVRLQRVPGPLGRLLPPQAVDQQVDGDRAIRPQDQVGEHHPLLRSPSLIAPSAAETSSGPRMRKSMASEPYAESRGHGKARGAGDIPHIPVDRERLTAASDRLSSLPLDASV